MTKAKANHADKFVWRKGDIKVVTPKKQLTKGK
jgi:hypothetical protein